MTANIVLKLNDGRSYIYGNVDTNRLYIGEQWLVIDQGCGETEQQWEMSQIKELLIKPMPEIHSKILAWEQSARDNPPKRIA